MTRKAVFKLQSRLGPCGWESRPVPTCLRPHMSPSSHVSVLGFWALTWRLQLGVAGRAGQRQALAEPVHAVEADGDVGL